MVGQEAVGQLAQRVGIEQGRADHSQFAGRIQARVDQRLLDHAQRQPAGVDQAIAQGDRQHHPEAMLLEHAVDVGHVLRRGQVRASGKKLQQ